MEFITQPFLLTAEDLEVSGPGTASGCLVNLGCCCLALTGS